tara:strand:- start:324 stop:1088 length:765 start_codon:yes stop_codon:yes gene_type:complete
MGKYFSVTKKMPIIASLQHVAFGAGDVLVDWQPIQIPKGSACLRSLTMLVRPKGDATPTDNNFGCDIVFSTTNTQSLGTVNSQVDHRPFPDAIGLIEITTGHYGINVFNSTAIATTNNNGDNEAAGIPIVLTGDPTTGDNVGYDTIYVGIVANGNFDFTSLNAIAEAGSAGAASTQVITMDGSGMDVREHFAAGDVVHIGTSVGTPAADSLIGTVASADSATQITLTDTSATDLVDGDTLYNLHPITLILGFEK